jgi:hypothetical protein
MGGQLSVLSRQCLDRHRASKEAVAGEVEPWTGPECGWCGVSV